MPLAKCNPPGSSISTLNHPHIARRVPAKIKKETLDVLLCVKSERRLLGKTTKVTICTRPLENAGDKGNRFIELYIIHTRSAAVNSPIPLPATASSMHHAPSL